MNIIFVTGFSEYKGDAMDMKASGYIMKPVTAEDIDRELSDLRFPIVPKKNALLRVQCFGNFEVFTPDGERVRFERSKSKELFAYLVHRSGSACTIKEIAAALFEDDPYDKKQLNYIQQLIHSLFKGLKAVGRFPRLQRAGGQSRRARLRLLPVQGTGCRCGQRFPE